MLSVSAGCAIVPLTLCSSPERRVLVVDRVEWDDGVVALPDTFRRFDLSRDWRVALVGAACVYEVVALSANSDRLPSLTQISWRLRVHRLGRFALWVTFGWLIEHIFGEGR